MIKAVLFDYYGVFRPDAYDAWLARYHFKRTGAFAALSVAADKNEITHDEFLNQLSRISSVERTSIADFFDMPHPIDQRFGPLLKTLHGNYRIGLISNGSSRTRDKLVDDGIAEYFDTITISAEIGAAKSDPVIYRSALRSLALHPDEVVYIDDNPRFVQAGRQLGITSFNFTDFESLEKFLTSSL